MKRRLALTFFLGIVFIGIGTLVLAQFFGIKEFPGGHLKVVYSTKNELSEHPGSFTVEIMPLGNDNYSIKTIFEDVQKKENIELGLFGLFFLGLHYSPETEAIDLSPLVALEGREIEPNKSYVLQGGARLQTQDRSKIAGLDVIMALYTHPDYPDQRVNIAIADLAVRNLLPFPPLLQLEKKKDDTFQMTAEIKLVEFTYQP